MTGLAKAGHEIVNRCETCHILQWRSSCRVWRRLSRRTNVGWPATCSARSVSFNRTARDAEPCGDTTSHDALVQRHFRSTLPYWEQIYSDQSVYGRIYQERARRAVACLDGLALSTGASVLEIGCGPGIITTAIARRGANVWAIDSLHEMVEQTMEMAERAGVASRLSARVGHIDDVPFADGRFDLVVVIGVTEWLVSLTRPLREIFRVLKPGGHLIISADNNWPLHQILDPLFSPVLKPFKSRLGRILRATGLRMRRPRFHAYSLAGFDHELKKAGFDKIAGQTFGFGPFTFCNQRLLNEQAGWKWHLRLQELADKGVPLLRSAGLVYLVLAKKHGSR
jgi:ubiquinone/menaquinone biosynthesis C-methylase UbiE